MGFIAKNRAVHIIFANFKLRPKQCSNWWHATLGVMCHLLEQSMSDEISLHDRKVIYRARRGLKELDIYFDPYVRQHYLTAPEEEKQAFALLIEQEDPDLLDWFMAVSEPEQPELTKIIERLKQQLH